jgi:hypothetical protein
MPKDVVDEIHDRDLLIISIGAFVAYFSRYTILTYLLCLSSGNSVSRPPRVDCSFR